MLSNFNDQKHVNNNDINDCIEMRNLRFFAISSLCRELSPTCMFKWPLSSHVEHISPYHMQHIVFQVVHRDSSAINPLLDTTWPFVYFLQGRLDRAQLL